MSPQCGYRQYFVMTSVDKRTLLEEKASRGPKPVRNPSILFKEISVTGLVVELPSGPSCLDLSCEMQENLFEPTATWSMRIQRRSWSL